MAEHISRDNNLFWADNEIYMAWDQDWSLETFREMISSVMVSQQP